MEVERIIVEADGGICVVAAGGEDAPFDQPAATPSAALALRGPETEPAP
jgi:hypothetical protein